MTHSNQTIAIIGGAGFVGKALAAELISRSGGAGGSVRILTRSRQKARSIWSLPGVEIQEVDPTDEAGLSEALVGARAVVNLVGLLHSRPGRPWGPDFDEAHVKFPSRLSRAMSRVGVRRLVHLSALGVAPQAPSMYLRSKSAGENGLKASHDIDLTILRPSVIFGPGDSFLNLFAKLQRWLPVVPLATPHSRFQPIYLGDAVKAIANCLSNPKTIGQAYELAGPDVLSLYEIVHWAGEYSGHPRPILPLPDSVSWLQALIMEQLPGPPMISRDNLASSSVPSVASGPISPELGIGIPHSLHAIAPIMLQDHSSRSRLLKRRTRRIISD